MCLPTHTTGDLMKQRKHLAKAAVSHALNLIVAGGFYMGASDPVQAAEKKTYTRPPFAAFSSQMDDALLGSDKYEKPVWNLHDALKLPELAVGIGGTAHPLRNHVRVFQSRQQRRRSANSAANHAMAGSPHEFIPAWHRVHGCARIEFR